MRQKNTARILLPINLLLLILNMLAVNLLAELSTHYGHSANRQLIFKLK